MPRARTKAHVLGRVGAVALKHTEPDSKTWSILELPMEDGQIKVIEDAAKTEGESVEEYIYGSIDAVVPGAPPP